MILSDLSIPFVTVALAELGDKSQILVFLLSSRTKKHLQLLAGVMLGFFIVDGLAILIGSWIVSIIPAFWLKTITGFMFMVMGGLMLVAKENNVKNKTHLSNPFVTGFLMILMAEWGDKTQIASALFAAKYNPLVVGIAVMAALFLLSASAIYFGKIIAHRVNKRFTTKAAGILFILLGLLSFIS